jgi:hypothetical protein
VADRSRNPSGGGNFSISSMRSSSIEEALEAIRQSGETTPATSARIERFSSRFSGTASITRSTSARSERSAV